MTRFPQAFLDEVRGRTNLGDLIAQKVRLTKAGPEFIGLCPFHSEKSPSFTVRPDKGFYHCFGCGAHGDAFRWMTEGCGLRFGEAVAALAAKAGMDVPGGAEAARKADKAPSLAPLASVVDREDEARKAARRREIAFGIWQGGARIGGTLVEDYLTGVRRIPGRVYLGSPVLRFAARAQYFDDDRKTVLHIGPAMLAAMQAVDGRFSALHMTFLDPETGEKLALPQRRKNGESYPAKKVLGDARGAAIRLCRVAPHMGAGEGIETCLSVAAAGTPSWAAYSLDNLTGPGKGQGAPHPLLAGKRLPSEVPDMERLGMEMPPECTRVTFLGDGDTKDLLALECRLRRGVRRAELRGRMADYVISPRGTDFNDLLRRGVA